MDIFDRVRRVAGNIPWGTVASVMAENLGADTAAAQEIIEQLKEWGGHLTKNALSKWTMSVMVPVACDSPDVSRGHPKPCPSYAVVKCDVCDRPCCLAHARVDYLGDAICEVCIGETKARVRAERAATGARGYSRPQGEAKRPPPREEPPPASPPAMSRKEALRALKLEQDATWAQIKAQYKKLAYKHNADRPQTDAERAKNNRLLKRINAAYALLREQHEKKPEAA